MQFRHGPFLFEDDGPEHRAFQNFQLICITKGAVDGLEPVQQPYAGGDFWTLSRALLYRRFSFGRRWIVPYGIRFCASVKGCMVWQAETLSNGPSA